MRGVRPIRYGREEAEALALQALSFLVSDEDRLSLFLALSGVAASELRARTGDAELLAAVLDHLLGDEALLLAFVAEAGLPPEAPATARRHLPGAPLM